MQCPTKGSIESGRLESFDGGSYLGSDVTYAFRVDCEMNSFELGSMSCLGRFLHNSLKIE